jgi:hypothetical protein
MTDSPFKVDVYPLSDTWGLSLSSTTGELVLFAKPRQLATVLSAFMSSDTITDSLVERAPGVIVEWIARLTENRPRLRDEIAFALRAQDYDERVEKV